MNPLNQHATTLVGFGTLLRIVLGSFALGLFLLPASGSLEAQENGGEDGISVYGPAFPPELEGLEQAHADYLDAWDSGDAGKLSNLLAQGVSIFTRDGLEVDYARLQQVLSMVVPHFRVRETHIHVLDFTEGWVSIGEILHFNDRRTDPEDAEFARFGTTLTVWERGPDLRWRVVFIAAPWIGPRTWSVLGRADGVDGSLKLVPQPGS